MIIAHRGASFTAPENTLAAINAAWRAGADAVEVDIRLTADGRIVLMHDPSTRRTTDKDYSIESTDSSLLRTLDAGSWKNERYTGEKIPFIEDVIRTVPTGKKLFIEIKTDESIFPVLKPYLTKADCAIIGFDIEIMSLCKKSFPVIPIYWLYEPPRLFKFGSRRSVEPGNLIDMVKKHRLDGIDIQHACIDHELCKIAELAEIDIYAWTVDDPVTARRLLDMGVKGITTNRPDLLKNNGL